MSLSKSNESLETACRFATRTSCHETFACFVCLCLVAVHLPPTSKCKYTSCMSHVTDSTGSESNLFKPLELNQHDFQDSRTTCDHHKAYLQCEYATRPRPARRVANYFMAMSGFLRYMSMSENQADQAYRFCKHSLCCIKWMLVQRPV